MAFNYCLIAIYDHIIETLYHGFYSFIFKDLNSVKLIKTTK
ncbi:hypothetical protein PS934_00785 [Pseudomonas fluorescens]|nr:hypothetical protein PS934_00785 [Pseudomonas fluorescens]